MNKLEILKEHLDEILNHIGIKPNVKVEETPEEMAVIIEGDNLNFLIGYRGESLDALQTLLGQIVYRKTNEWLRITVDINDYRSQKAEKIEDITKSFIDRVRFFQKDVEMSPMNANERRLVHTFVSQYSDIASESIGEGYNRRVVLKLKKA